MLLGIFGGKIVLDELDRQQDVHAFQARVALVAATKELSSSKASAAISANTSISNVNQNDTGVEPKSASLESNLLTTAINEPDQRLWSQSRKQSYANLPNVSSSNVLGILSIPAVDLTVPIYDGADDLNLDRGVARIQGTYLPNQNGNSGIAGHRDGYFRVLKDVQIGQEINVTGMDGIETYSISEILIVDPTDVSVLDNTSSSSLTLVTCYPFYFLGHAPKRYIVKAKLKHS